MTSLILYKHDCNHKEKISLAMIPKVSAIEPTVRENSRTSSATSAAMRVKALTYLHVNW